MQMVITLWTRCRVNLGLFSLGCADSVHLLRLRSRKAGGTEMHTGVLSTGKSLQLVSCGPESRLGAALL